MTSLLSFRLFDAESKEGKTSVNLPDSITLGEVDTFVSLFRSVLLPLTNARLFDARWIYYPPISPSGPASPLSNVYTRLLLVCTNGEKTGSITIPSPAGLNYLQSGPYDRYKVDKTHAESVSNIEGLISALTQTTLPYGDDFPFGTWEASLMVTD